MRHRRDVLGRHAGWLRFHPAAHFTGAVVSAVQRRIRSCALHLAVRAPLTPDVAADLTRSGHGGGFSLHAATRIEAVDRAGLEQLLRYCVCPSLASGRLAWDGPSQPARHTLPEPLPAGQTELSLIPLGMIDRLAALVPSPRRHRHHYAGVYAPLAALRARNPPELKTDRVGTPQFAFDPSSSWDPITPPPDLRFSFDQILD